MDAVKFFKERNRMCDYFTGNSVGTVCIQCPLSAINNNKHEVCEKFIGNNPEQAVKIVEKFSEENPVKTRADVFKELFPNADLTEMCESCIDGNSCRDFWTHDYNCSICRDKYWNAPAPEDFGKGGGTDE